MKINFPRDQQSNLEFIKRSGWELFLVLLEGEVVRDISLNAFKDISLLGVGLD